MIDFLSRTTSHCVLPIFFRHSRAVALVSLLFRIQVSLRAIDQGRNAPAATAPDAEVKELRLEDLTATPQTRPPGYERNYFEGVLANRTGHIDDSIRLLNEALLYIRQVHLARAAVALETLADDYNRSFRYTQADATCDDRLRHFAGAI
jgi:hypothetical protein